MRQLTVELHFSDSFRYLCELCILTCNGAKSVVNSSGEASKALGGQKAWAEMDREGLPPPAVGVPDIARGKN